MSDLDRELFEHQGFLVLRGVLSEAEVRSCRDRIEQGVDGWAADLQVTREEYLDVACRWSSPNPVVDGLVAGCAERLAPIVEKLGGPGHQVSRASVLRKSRAASCGTHGHQDAGYWVRPSSRRYSLSTWISLDHAGERRAALVVRPGSHRQPLEPPVDFLRRGFIDPVSSWGEDRKTLSTRPGDVVVFGPRLWHASHPMRDDAVRRALAIRWVGLGLDGEVAPSPEGAEPFGMYSSGRCLREVLSRLAGREVAPGLAGVEWALERGLAHRLPNAHDARRVLQRVCLHLRACERHRAADQRGMVWDEVRDKLVMPVLGGTGC